MLTDAKRSLRVFLRGCIFGPLFFLLLTVVDRALLLVQQPVANTVNGYLIWFYPPTQSLDAIVTVSSSTWIAWIWTLLIFALYYGAIFLIVWRVYQLFFKRHSSR